MRRLLTGLDAVGRSCLVEQADVQPQSVEDGHGVLLERVFALGELRSMVVEHPPSTAIPIHPSDALDVVFVHEGEGELLLQDGAHPVAAGDLVVVPAVAHAMRAGPSGLRLVVVKLGSPPSAS